MTSLSIVEPLNVIKDISTCFVSGSIFASLNAFAFQCRKEALNDRVIVTTTFAAQATDDAMPFKESLEVVA
jgi:hypothetical protein